MTNHTDYSIDDWTNILEPYGYVDITTHAPACLHGSPHLISIRFNIALKEETVDTKLNEWERRLKVMNTARLAVEAVQAHGFTLEDAPRIEFGGNYYHLMGRQEIIWNAEARLMFEVYTTY
jgi:hypothetical protein